MPFSEAQHTYIDALKAQSVRAIFEPNTAHKFPLAGSTAETGKAAVEDQQFMQWTSLQLSKTLQHFAGVKMETDEQRAKLVTKWEDNFSYASYAVFLNPTEESEGDPDFTEQPEVQKGIWRHWRGDYRVIGTATYWDAGTRHVIFHPENDPSILWTRPIDEFLSGSLILIKADE